MMNMMYSTGSASGIFWFAGLHSLAASAFIVGVVLLIVWAVKTLTPAQLKLWGLSLGIGGLVVCALTYAATPFGFHMRNAGWTNERGDMVRVMNNIMDDDMMMDADDMMDHRMMDDDDMMSMSMRGMSEMLKGKTGDEFDKAFIEGMIPHHQGAIDMANMALTSARHAEIREMATEIITAQQREIDMMNQWLKDWGYSN